MTNKRTRAEADACWYSNLTVQINPPRKKQGKITFLGIRRKDEK